MHPIFNHIAEGDLAPVVTIINGTPRHLLKIFLETEDDDGETVLSLAVEKQHTHIIKFLIMKGADISQDLAWDRYFEANGIAGVIACVPDGRLFSQQVAFICGYALLQRLEQNVSSDILSLFIEKEERKVIQREALRVILRDILENVDADNILRLLQALEVMMSEILNTWGLEEPHWQAFRPLLAAKPFSIYVRAVATDGSPSPVVNPVLLEEDKVEHPRSYLNNGVLKLSTTAYLALSSITFGGGRNDPLSSEREIPRSK